MVTRGRRPAAAQIAAGGVALATAVLTTIALGGCTLITDSFLTNDFSGDPFPVAVDTASGALLVGLAPAGEPPRRAVLDLLSPFTLVDPGRSAEPSLRYVDLTLLGEDPSGALVLPRARFPEAQLIALHPCTAPDGADPQMLPPCSVGTPGDPRPIDAVIGADALAGDAIRLRLGADQIFVLPDIGGSTRARSLSCDAVFNAPYRGGGTLVIAGTELPFGNRRITLSACLGQDADPGAMPTSVRQHGADALFVVSTSIGISILNEATYERYRIAVPEAGAPALAALPVDTVYLPSGPITGRRATIDRMALVGASISNDLSPCRHVYAHRTLADGPLAQMAGDANEDCDAVTGNDCPCKNGNAFCDVPSVFELTPPAGVAVLVVPDTEPTLQALRTELRPDQPEVDGLLGSDVLRAGEIDVDYPHDRLIARCAGPGCLARPQMTDVRDRCQVNHCIHGSTDNLGCSAR